MAIQDLKEQIARLPEQPGVYLFADAAGETIYVGKARALRDRVRSYLGARGTSPKTDALLDEASALEVIVTDSVVEALALENNLIKQRAPKFNILLRDDKSYPYLRLTLSEAFPRVLVARQVARDGDLYAGPFLPASLARRTIRLSHTVFGLRSCNEVITGKRPRACLEYDIKRCLAPCVDTICTPERYGRAVDDMRLVLEGKVDELATTLEGRMLEAAAAERFEEAAQVRDTMRVVQALGARQQKMATPAFGDRDVFGVAVGAGGAVVQLFMVRRGRVVERVTLQGAAADVADGPAALVAAALQQIYEHQDAPREIDLPVAIDDADVTEAWLSSRSGRRVQLSVPQRGDRRRLVELANRNADLALRQAAQPGAEELAALGELRAALDLPGLPHRIECLDISTLQGSQTVAAVVVCLHGRLAKAEYRKYRLKGGETAGQGAATFLNDFAAIAEVVQRRFSRILESGGPMPDLLVIDGGRGQLEAAYGALEQLGLSTLVAVGLAKREELVVTRDADRPVAFPRSSAALLLLQRLRDEAHRFAVTYHRTARRQRDFGSELDTVAGVGPRRRRALLTAFGSVAGVRRATREDLVPVVGQRCADAVLAHFARAISTG